MEIENIYTIIGLSKQLHYNLFKA